MLSIEQHVRNISAIVAAERFLYSKLESVARYLKVQCGFFGVTIIKSTGDEYDDHIYMCAGRSGRGLQRQERKDYFSAEPQDPVSVIGARNRAARQLADHLATRSEALIPIARNGDHLGTIAIELLQDQVLSEDEIKLLYEVASLLSNEMEPAVMVVVDASCSA